MPSNTSWWDEEEAQEAQEEAQEEALLLEAQEEEETSLKNYNLIIKLTKGLTYAHKQKLMTRLKMTFLEKAEKAEERELFAKAAEERELFAKAAEESNAGERELFAKAAEESNTGERKLSDKAAEESNTGERKLSDKAAEESNAGKREVTISLPAPIFDDIGHDGIVDSLEKVGMTVDQTTATTSTKITRNGELRTTTLQVTCNPILFEEEAGLFKKTLTGSMMAHIDVDVQSNDEGGAEYDMRQAPPFLKVFLQPKRKEVDQNQGQVAMVTLEKEVTLQFNASLKFDPDTRKPTTPVRAILEGMFGTKPGTSIDFRITSHGDTYKWAIINVLVVKATAEGVQLIEQWKDDKSDRKFHWKGLNGQTYFWPVKDVREYI